MIDPHEATTFLAFALTWNGGQLPLYVDRKGKPWRWLEERARLWPLSQRLDHERSVEVAVGLPSTDRLLGPMDSTIMWAWIESSQSLFRATRFRPAPSLVLRMGGAAKRLLIWLLDEPTSLLSVEPANKRLSYALHGPQKYGESSRLRIPLPGTFLRVERRRPAPVLVTRMELETHSLDGIAGRLREPPLPYVERLRRGEVTK